ncbi:MAG: tetratricopeptide repeat protein [Kiritimatiellae bacterium]|nr:tetratricopeptide repeat protein [Kiritimatiellia bacterium]
MTRLIARRKILALAAAFAASFAGAAPAGGDAAKAEISVAREALRDGLWTVARNHAAKVGTDEAKLIILESYAGEGKWDDVGRSLSGWKDAKGDGFDYYRAVVKGDHAAALAALKRGGSPEGLVEVKMFEAAALAKSGNQVAANGIWREIAASTNVREKVRAAACANLMDAEVLRSAYDSLKSVPLRRIVGLRLGAAMLRDAKTDAEGEKLIRAIVKDAPDTDGAREALLAVADARVSAGRWKAAAEAYHEAIETWPDVAKIAAVQEGRGWVFVNMGRREEALEAFRLAGQFAADDEERALAAVKEGDVLQGMGRAAESMERYRFVLEKHPGTKVAKVLKAAVETKELEARGRELFRGFKFEEAMKVFGEVAKADASRAERMDFLTVLCLYGQGRDEEAMAGARRLADGGKDAAVRSEAGLWLAKFLYNRREWKESKRLFLEYAKAQGGAETAAEALLWAARAAFAESDYNLAIRLSTELADGHPDSSFKTQGLLVQGEALIELARFDEAVLLFERVASSPAATSAVRARAQMLKADALFAMGADNSSRYVAALDAYRSIRFGGALTASEQIVVSFRIARSLEKLKRMDEAVDQYYTQVVLAYRSGRLDGVHYTDEARAAFSTAAFRLADEFESRGRDRQAAGILELVAESDVPAAEEAMKRIERISNKGGFL